MTTVKRCIPMAVFVIALLIGQLTCHAQSQVPQMNGGRVQPNPGSSPSLVPSRNSLRKFAPIRTGEAEMPEDSFNGYAQIRSTPDLGAPGSAGNGFHHFSMPFDKYTTWYRPRAATLTKYQRCERFDRVALDTCSLHHATDSVWNTNRTHLAMHPQNTARHMSRGCPIRVANAAVTVGTNVNASSTDALPLVRYHSRSSIRRILNQRE